MRNDRYPIGAIAIALLMAGCGSKPAITLPADPQARAATCYAARIALFGTQGGGTALTVEQANEAAHFLLLGASANGIAEPETAKTLAARGQALEAAISERKNASDYVEPCARAYPETLSSAFKGLPADGSETRMMCFTLANALGQIHRASDVPSGGKAETYARLDAALDTRISDEIRAAGAIDPGQLLTRATRGLAAAAHAGPPTQVLDACAARYLKP